MPRISPEAGRMGRAQPHVIASKFRRNQPDRLPVRQTNLSIGQRYGRSNRRHLDLIPEFRVGGRLYLEPMIVRALPWTDHLGQIVQYEVALCRYDDKNQ